MYALEMYALELPPRPVMSRRKQCSQLSRRRCGWVSGSGGAQGCRRYGMARIRPKPKRRPRQWRMRLLFASTRLPLTTSTGPKPAKPAQDAYADYVFATSDYGKIRWRAAGLIFSNEAIVLGGAVEDSTLQVALDRALEAYRVAAAADTVAAFDFAHEATEIATQLTAVSSSDSDEPAQAVEAPESTAAPLEASEAWFKATEALQDAVEAAKHAEDAQHATATAASARQAAAGDVEDAAWAIYRAAQADGDWEAMVADTRAHVAAARSAAEAAAGFAIEALDAQTATEAAAEAARIAVLASEAARALAEQSGTTEGAEAYTEAYRNAHSEGRSPRHDAAYFASVAAAIAGPIERNIALPATAVARNAAWRAAQVLASVDHRGVAAFKKSLQQSCR